MDTYVILRRQGWRTPEELEAAGKKSAQIGGEEMPDDIRWIRSYTLAEEDGTVSEALPEATYPSGTPRSTTVHECSAAWSTISGSPVQRGASASRAVATQKASA